MERAQRGRGEQERSRARAQGPLSRKNLPVRPSSWDGSLEGLSVVFKSESCERCEYVYLKWIQEMRYSCAENVTQLSTARDGLSVLRE